MTDVLLAWLVRWGHVAAAGVWVGGYAVLALVIVPSLQKRPDEAVARLALASVRLLPYAGAATMLFGLLLIWRTRGFASLWGGEWGGIVISSFVVAFALMGIGDGPLRASIRRLVASGDGQSAVGEAGVSRAAGERGPAGRAARRWAIAALVLVVLAVALMTRAPYAR